MTATDDLGTWWEGPIGATLRTSTWGIKSHAGCGGIEVVVGEVTMTFQTLAEGLATTERWGFAERATDPETAAVQKAMEVAWGALVVCGPRVTAFRAGIA